MRVHDSKCRQHAFGLSTPLPLKIIGLPCSAAANALAERLAGGRKFLGMNGTSDRWKLPNMAGDAGSASPTVGSVVQALTVLRHLAGLQTGVGVTAIASSLAISPSSCFNILKTLVAEEFLEFDKQRKTYRLGLGAIDLARNAIGASNVFPTLKDKLRELSERYEITAGLWRLANPERLVLIGVGESPQATRIHMAVGQRVPLLAGAIGRCAAATSTMSDDDIARELELVRWQSRPSLSDYFRQIDGVRRMGWALDSGQWRRGVTTVGAPIVDDDRMFQFGITASMFTDQHDHITIQTICEEVRAMARYASERAFGSSEATPDGSKSRNVAQKAKRVSS